eukprot:CAMPEP_0206432740 /NCGR_PEP_ID=MMETSP0324_2-20121206/8133_1 /ASSEMBLY_ACC=CAM_ASM_000836 /TAXON_ID=2866 /ORGANISM="Crypthecodinium cohnii, Strain Seligo" /LENGTH=39 /DNA_ID= /DNA_START= /DNA_END= /DNA_ORIENTATION=
MNYMGRGRSRGALVLAADGNMAFSHPVEPSVHGPKADEC